MGYIFCSRFLFIYFLTILVRPIFSEIYRSDLRQIFSVGRTVGIDNQSEISSSIPQGTLPWQPFFGSARVSLGAVAQPGGLTLDFALQLYFSSKWEKKKWKYSKSRQTGSRQQAGRRMLPSAHGRTTQSCPWVELTHGLGWVGSRFFSFWCVGLGWVHYRKSTKNLKGLC